jgi:hypothetical protein
MKYKTFDEKTCSFKSQIDKNIIHRIDFDRVKLPIAQQHEFDGFVYSMQQTIGKQIAESVDSEILEMLYNAYKDTECDTLIILDKSEFKYFLLKYLPIYLEERNEELQ